MDAVLFDLDNTLISWDAPVHKHVVVNFLKAMGVADPEEFYDEKWHSVEDRMQGMLITFEDYMKIGRPMLFHMITKTKEEMIPQYAHLAPGALKVLRRIRAPKALVSNSLAEDVHYTLRYFKIEKYFDYVYERDYYNEDEHKPKRIVAEKVCDALGVKPSKRVLMVGDSRNDILLAKNAGLTSIAIGPYHKEADYYYPNLDEFARHMRQF